MVRTGILAGLGFLLTVALLEYAAGRPAAPRTGQETAEGDISDQVWQVLAEARRILEESS